MEELRVYLFSSGKKEDEIDEIVEELEVHLLEAEEQGKPIEKVVGDSPKAYMEQLSSVMDIDTKTWFKYALIIILGSFSFKIIGDLLRGELSYSILAIIGHIVISGMFILGLFGAFRYISARQVSNVKQFFTLAIVGGAPFLLFLV